MTLIKFIDFFPNYCVEQDEENKSVLDLSKNCLKKVPKQEDAQTIKTLILDDNELQKIDNIDSFHRIEKVKTFY